MRFLDGIPATRKEELLKQLKAVWTHDSTAIEGNTLTLGDTMFVLEYGLTVKGKPLKDQIDVQNHANAVDAVMDLVMRGRLMEEDVFTLHRIVINEQSEALEGQTLMVGFGWWGCAKLWYNVRHEAVAQLQDQPVLPSDQPHCQLRETRPDRFQACDKCLALPRYGRQ